MFRSRIYRHDNESLILVFTILLVLGVIVLTSTVTFCISGVFIVGMFILSAVMIRSHHQSLMRHTLAVNDLHTPELAQLVEDCAIKLQPGDVDVFLANEDQLNAYTFGMGTPKVLVLYRPLLQVMSPKELMFVVGHEMGHVALGHTWLNTIVGGLAGIPAPFGAAVLLYAAFRWWNRLCEYSADRAGLLACGDLNVGIAALVKLVAPEVRTQRDFEKALTLMDAEDDLVSNRFLELFQSHPMLIRRIEKLKAYAQTKEYIQLQTGVNRNAAVSSREYDNAESHSYQGDENKTMVSERNPKPQLTPEEKWPWLKSIDQE